MIVTSGVGEEEVLGLAGEVAAVVGEGLSVMAVRVIVEQNPVIYQSCNCWLAVTALCNPHKHKGHLNSDAGRVHEHLLTMG